MAVDESPKLAISSPAQYCRLGAQESKSAGERFSCVKKVKGRGEAGLSLGTFSQATVLHNGRDWSPGAVFLAR